MAKIQCPCCGSTDNWLKQEPREYTPLFGTTVRYEVMILHCTACHEESAHEPGPDPMRVQAILQHADQSTVPVMLDLLEAKGYSQVNIKRYLGLLEAEQRDWRCGAPTLAVALLRILAAHPWILEKLAYKDRGVYCGDPGVRDPDCPCEFYEPGTPAGTNCWGDGHYLCQECTKYCPPNPDEPDRNWTP